MGDFLATFCPLVSEGFPAGSPPAPYLSCQLVPRPASPRPTEGPPCCGKASALQPGQDVSQHPVFEPVGRVRSFHLQQGPSLTSPPLGSSGVAVQDPQPPSPGAPLRDVQQPPAAGPPSPPSRWGARPARAFQRVNAGPLEAESNFPKSAFQLEFNLNGSRVVGELRRAQADGQRVGELLPQISLSGLGMGDFPCLLDQPASAGKGRNTCPEGC